MVLFLAEQGGKIKYLGIYLDFANILKYDTFVFQISSHILISLLEFAKMFSENY